MVDGVGIYPNQDKELDYPTVEEQLKKLEEIIKSSTTATNDTPAIQISKISLVTDAKISFVFSAILEHFSDIWISKKSDGSYSVEEMDGPICVFHLKEGKKINFTADSFKNLNPNIKLAIQKKFIELSKLI